jgi:cysteine protease ATG4
MNPTDIERCKKRIVQYLWDPEPKNDEEPGSPIWCLGTRYPPPEQRITPHEGTSKTKETTPSDRGNDCSRSRTPSSQVHHNGRQTDTARTSTPDWPEPFLLDFESKIWMTYRSNFTPIAKDTSREGNQSLTMGVRLRSQFIEPQGFTTDTGWGCMIRSGQSLLANAMAIVTLGRGMSIMSDRSGDSRAANTI